jgi:hypothetical protein
MQKLAKDNEQYLALLQKENLGRQKADLHRVMSRVEMIVRRRFHQGHPILGYGDLRNDCMVKMIEIVSSPGNRKLPLANLLRLVKTSIENHITDLRRAHCLTKSRGATTIHIQEIVNAEGEAIDFEEPLADRHSPGSIYASQDVRDSRTFASDVIRLARMSMNDEQKRTLDALMLIGDREPKAVSRILKVRRLKARELVEQVASEINWAHRLLDSDGDDASLMNPWVRGTCDFYLHNALIWFARHADRYRKDGKIIIGGRRLAKRMKQLGCARPTLRIIKRTCYLYDRSKQSEPREKLVDWFGSLKVTMVVDTKDETGKSKIPQIEIVHPDYFLK